MKLSISQLAFVLKYIFAWVNIDYSGIEVSDLIFRSSFSCFLGTEIQIYSRMEIESFSKSNGMQIHECLHWKRRETLQTGQALLKILFHMGFALSSSTTFLFSEYLVSWGHLHTCPTCSWLFCTISMYVVIKSFICFRCASSTSWKRYLKEFLF